MNPFLRQHLSTAEKANGIRFDAIADWDDLLDLHRLAEVVTNAEAKGGQALIRPCVEIGGQLFHRMTIGAGEWFAAVSPWFEATPAEYALCLSYASAGARDPVAMLWPYASNRDRLAVRLHEWSKGLGCTPEELVAGVGAFLSESQPEEMPGNQDANADTTESAPSGFGYTVDLLLSEYGGTPEQWIWHTARETVLDLQGKIAARHRAKAGKAHADPNDPRVIASDRFVTRLKALVAKKKEATDGPTV